mmetsp:Transcript_69638/g.110412  ORF Transcript_69638/g.110412 Transcript_69638/m.110412 type:complete len:122 (-) Transcript_69638:870-1235(-)
MLPNYMPPLGQAHCGQGVSAIRAHLRGRDRGRYLPLLHGRQHRETVVWSLRRLADDERQDTMKVVTRPALTWQLAFPPVQSVPVWAGAWIHDTRAWAEAWIHDDRGWAEALIHEPPVFRIA